MTFLKNNAVQFVAAAFLFTTYAQAAVVLELDAAASPIGEISETQNAIPGGRWQPNVALRVESVAGRQAFVFDGTQTLIAAPLTTEKWDAFTVEAWVMNPSIERLETVAAICSVKGGMGTEFNFSSSASAGAFRSGFKATTPFAVLPATGTWHHLAWSYGGGVLRVFVDGERELERPLRVTLPVPMKVHVGASGEVDNKGPKKAFSGAIAKVKLHNAALTQEELRASGGFTAPYAPEPRNGATTDTLSVTLRWTGAKDATVFAGMDRAAVERGDASASKPPGPLALRLGATYFWRVVEGGLSSPVWTFTADAGLAAEPLPRDATSNTLPTLARLAWRPGKYATAQRVFIGVSREEMKLAAELDAAAVTSALPFALAPGTRYFWRVESDNGAQPKSPGAVWSFRTQDTPVHEDITFFTSSDSHYGRENNAAINRRVIDAMNALPGASAKGSAQVAAAASNLAASFISSRLVPTNTRCAVAYLPGRHARRVSVGGVLLVASRGCGSAARPASAVKVQTGPDNFPSTTRQKYVAPSRNGSGPGGLLADASPRSTAARSVPAKTAASFAPVHRRVTLSASVVAPLRGSGA